MSGAAVGGAVIDGERIAAPDAFALDPSNGGFFWLPTLFVQVPAEAAILGEDVSGPLPAHTQVKSVAVGIDG